MPIATFITPDDHRVEVDVPNGTSLMHAATAAGVSSIVGDCGGAMSCATCHVLVEPDFLPELDAASDTESQMLDYTAAPRQPNSRLSCQLVMNERLAGIVVRVADPQI
jgi:2Fe-2S ferredoxin